MACWARQCFHDAIGNGLDQSLLVLLASQGGSGAVGSIKSAATDARFLPTVAKDVVGANVAVLVFRSRARIGKPPLLLEVQQFLGFVSRYMGDAAQALCQHEDTTIGVEDFRPPIGPFDVFAEADRAVIGKDDDIGLFHKGDNGIGKGLSAGRFIFGDRYITEENFDFGQDALGDRLAGNGERSGMGRVTMDDTFHVGSVLENFDVQQGFTGPFFPPGNLPPCHVHRGNVIGLEKALAMHGGRTQDLVFIQANRDIAVVGGCKPLVVDSTPDITYVLFQLEYVGHGVPFRGMGQKLDVHGVAGCAESKVEWIQTRRNIRIDWT